VLIPVQAYLTSGVGIHREELVAFELALRGAGIAAQNLVAVSSILPPDCELIPRAEGEQLLKPGQILHVVISREQTCEPHRILGAAIGIARPTDRSLHGFIAEYNSLEKTGPEIASHAEDLAVTMLASTLGVEIDEALGTRTRADALSIDGRVEHHDAICAATEGDADGRWTVVVAAAVFIMEWMRPADG
jgi:arginine decarboxylase